MDTRTVLAPALSLLDRLTPQPHTSRIPATPPPDYAAGLAFHTRGHGVPIVLLHGLGSSRAAYNPIFADLAQHHRVYAVDLPGHGDSAPLHPGEPLTPKAQAFALGEFLDALGIDRAHLVGNSMGGYVALEAAADERALSVVGLCPAGLWQPLIDRNGLIDLNRAAAATFGPLGELILGLPFLRRAIFATAMERPYRMDFTLARAVAVAQRTAPGFDDAHEGLLGVRFERGQAIPATVPVTVAFGDNDILLPPRTSQDVALAPRHTRFVTMSRVGHAPMWDDPEGTVSIIRSTVAAAGAA